MRRNSRVADTRLLIAAAVFLTLGSAGIAQDRLRPERIAAAAATLLDDSQTPDRRREMIAIHAAHPGALIAEMVRGMGVDPAEEYRRIPWIWRVAVAAGQRNETDQLKSVLEVSLPADDAPLRDWQSVVIGGGVINGLTQAGEWPRSRVEEILGDDADLRRRWNRANDLAVALANNEQVNHGTRYDALRMVGMRDWAQCGPQLRNYLKRGTHRELQMGAVSACGDVNDRRAAEVLIESLPGLDARNVPLAVSALKRTAERKQMLDDAVADGRVSADLLKIK